MTAGLVASAVVLGARGTRGVRPWDGVGAGVRIAEADETDIRTVLDNPLSAEQRGTQGVGGPSRENRTEEPA